MNVHLRIDHDGVRALSSDLSDRYRAVRTRMPDLARGLSTEDLAAQSMADASPGKWHLGHTSWFFEAMILSRIPGYQPVDAQWNAVFNSYYESLGKRVERPSRGLMTRPSLDDVLTYRREIDRRMVGWLEAGVVSAEERALVELGLAHEEQHHELFLTDLLHLMSCSPLSPAAFPQDPTVRPSKTENGGWRRFESGLVKCGVEGSDTFAFDNEQPSHRVYLAAYEIADDLVSNADWQAFIADGGYRRPELWLSDGWGWVRDVGVAAPLHWRDDGQLFTLGGLVARDDAAPVRHVSYYEADAYARWKGARLPTEFEWENAALRGGPGDLFDRVWQWTASPYVAYPGFKPRGGAVSEYNGKFMANQMVCRGGSAATAPGHSRATYRNFFYPHQRWQFLGLRLARDVAGGVND
jgi:ergothioneine biosynthesis protein EgtB